MAGSVHWGDWLQMRLKSGGFQCGFVIGLSAPTDMQHYFHCSYPHWQHHSANERDVCTSISTKIYLVFVYEQIQTCHCKLIHNQSSNQPIFHITFFTHDLHHDTKGWFTLFTHLHIVPNYITFFFQKFRFQRISCSLESNQLNEWYIHESDWFDSIVNKSSHNFKLIRKTDLYASFFSTTLDTIYNVDIKNITFNCN